MRCAGAVDCSVHSGSLVLSSRGRLVEIVVPLGLVNVGPGFSEYERAE